MQTQPVSFNKPSHSWALHFQMRVRVFNHPPSFEDVASEVLYAWKYVRVQTRPIPLHAGAQDDNAKAIAALIQNGADPDACCENGTSAVHVASANYSLAALQVLCVAGARLTTAAGPPNMLVTPLDAALLSRGLRCATFLVANGVRVESISKHLEERIPHYLRELQRGVLACRSAVVTLLLVKQKKRGWSHVDKFLMREIAFDVWCTRDDEKWTS